MLLLARSPGASGVLPRPSHAEDKHLPGASSALLPAAPGLQGTRGGGRRWRPSYSQSDAANPTDAAGGGPTRPVRSPPASTAVTEDATSPARTSLDITGENDARGAKTRSGILETQLPKSRPRKRVRGSSLGFHRTPMAEDGMGDPKGTFQPTTDRVGDKHGGRDVSF